MTFVATNDYVTGRKAPVTANDSSVQVMRFETKLTAADVAANSIGAVGVLPASAVPIGIILDTDATSGVAMVAQFGILASTTAAAFSTSAADGGAAWGSSAAASATLTAQQVLSRAMLNDVQPSNSDRFIGMKITTAPSSAVTQTVGVTLLYRQV